MRISSIIEQYLLFIIQSDNLEIDFCLFKNQWKPFSLVV